MINIAVCDDDEVFAEGLKNMIESMKTDYLLQLKVELYSHGMHLLRKVRERKRYDILFMDIAMKAPDGIEVANRIRKLDKNIIIIFVSSYNNYFVRLFDAEPVGFLPKPLHQGDFEKLFQKAYQKALRQDNYYMFEFNKNIYKLSIRDICYFESKGRVIHAVTRNNRYRFYEKLSQVENLLEDKCSSFLRVHQSFLVNVYHIDHLGYLRIFLKDGTELPVSEDRHKQIRIEYARERVLT